MSLDIEPYDILMSIRPEYSQAIFDGTKRVEYRKRLPNTWFEDEADNRRVWVYETKPTGKIVGLFKVQAIGTWNPQYGDITGPIYPHSGISREDLRAYAKGQTLYAILIGSPVRIEPIDLPVTAPQSWMYMQSRFLSSDPVVAA
jgi:predicted transcriptional regulator